MIITCEYCEFNCKTYEDWFTHLLTQGHQTTTLPVSGWTEETINRSIYIEPTKSVTQISFSEREVWVRYFRQFGTITEVVLPDHFRFFIIQFDSIKMVEQSPIKKPHYVRCVELRVRGLWTLTDKERKGMTGNIFQLNKLPMSVVQPQPQQATRPKLTAEDMKQPIPTPRNIKPVVATTIKQGKRNQSPPVTSNPFLTLGPPHVQKLHVKPFNTNPSELRGSEASPGGKTSELADPGMKSDGTNQSLPALMNIRLSTVGVGKNDQTPKAQPFSEKTLHVSPPATSRLPASESQTPCAVNSQEKIPEAQPKPNNDATNKAFSTPKLQQNNSNATNNGQVITISAPASGTQDQPKTANNPSELTFNQILKDLSATIRLKKSPNKSPPGKQNTINTNEINTLVARHKYMATNFEKESLDKQLDYFIIETTLDQAKENIRENFLYELAHILRNNYPSCCLHPFGSYLTRLADLDSDIDIYVDVFGTAYTDNHAALPKDRKMDIFHAIKNVLRRSRKFSQVVPIANARVPIIKIVHSASSVKADLSFENLMSVQNSLMIRFYTTVDPHVRPLLILVRYWAHFHGLTGPNYVKNYGLVLMALVFLTRKHFIPPVYMLQELTPKTLLINGWNTAFCQNADLVINSSIVKDWRRPVVLDENGVPRPGPITALAHLALAKEFFETFATFDYDNLVICSLMGDFLPRASFRKGAADTELPVHLNRYKAWLSSQPTEQQSNTDKDRGFDLDSPLCIQDPFNLGFNVCGCTKEPILTRFKEGCHTAAKELTNIIAKNSGNLMNIFVPMPQEKRMSRKDRIKAEEIEAFEIKLAAARAPSNPNPKPFVHPLSSYTDTVKLSPTGNFELFIQSLVKRGEAPRQFLEDLADIHWLNLMAEFLKKVLQQVYQLEVEVEDYSTFNNRDWHVQGRKDDDHPSKVTDNDNPGSRSGERNVGAGDSDSNNIVPPVALDHDRGSTDPPTTTNETNLPDDDAGMAKSWARGQGHGRARIAKRPFIPSPTEMVGNGNGNGNSTLNRVNGRGRGHKLLKPTSPTKMLVGEVEADEDNKQQQVDHEMIDLESVKSESSSVSAVSGHADQKSESDVSPLQGTDSKPHYFFILHCSSPCNVWENRKNFRRAALKKRNGEDNMWKLEKEVTKILMERSYPKQKPTVPIIKFDIGVSSCHATERSYSRAKPVFNLIFTDVRNEDPVTGATTPFKHNLQALYFFANGQLLSSLGAPGVHCRFSNWFEEHGREYIKQALAQRGQGDNSSSS